MKIVMGLVVLSASLYATDIFSVDFTLGGVNPILCPSPILCTAGDQTGRLSRNGVESTWDVPKANPGLTITTGTREFGAYSFTNTLGVSVFYQVELTSADGANQFVDAYTGAGFVPANPSTNYLADSGSSSTDQIFQFVLAAGSSATVVASSILVDPYVGDYHLLVTGFLDEGFTNLDGTSTAPEPASIGLLAIGIGGLALTKFRRQRG